ncbi:DUF6313 family protein [Streptomyces qinglanensis]|uniref:DUF6313 family protein n=1 Tax=Streptomyces qinglanensis TaxID=943816 RepID=UPI001160D378|nr:DUF6313 family protein [Streptomyces qinglanensis]
MASPDSPSQEPPPPSPDTFRERLRDWKRSLASLNNLSYWWVTRGAWCAAAFTGLYLLSGALIGWTCAYEVMIGITSPAKMSAPPAAWALSMVGWLFVPAFIGAVSGYLVSQQVDRRQRESQEEFFQRIIDQVGPPPSGGAE